MNEDTFLADFCVPQFFSLTFISNVYISKRGSSKETSLRSSGYHSQYYFSQFLFFVLSNYSFYIFILVLHFFLLCKLTKSNFARQSDHHSHKIRDILQTTIFWTFISFWLLVFIKNFHLHDYLRNVVDVVLSRRI